MRAALLDVDVLIALAWPTHVQHEPAHAWFGTLNGGRWATCPTTQSGFIRVSSNARLLSYAKTPAEALALLKRIVALPGHDFWPDETNLAATPFLAAERVVSHGQVTDAHLLALALQRKGRLVTFDAGVKALLPPGSAPESLLVLGSPQERNGVGSRCFAPATGPPHRGATR